MIRKLAKMMKNMEVGDTMEIIRNDKVIHITRIDIRGHFVVKTERDQYTPVYSHTVIHWLMTNQI